MIHKVVILKNELATVFKNFVIMHEKKTLVNVISLKKDVFSSNVIAETFFLNQKSH